MFNIFKKKQKPLDEVIKSYLQKSQEAKKTYVVAVIHKKNKQLYNVVTELESEIITIDKTPYYAGTDAIFYRNETINKKSFNIPFVDVYEGCCLCVHPSKSSEEIKFSKRVVDMISLKLEQGILENRRKHSMDMKKILIFSLVGIAAAYIIFKMF